MKKRFRTFLLVAASVCGQGEVIAAGDDKAVEPDPVTVAPENSVIVIPADLKDGPASAAVAAAARELGLHLKLITGCEFKILEGNGDLAGRYPFYVGIPAPGDARPMAAEEARWAVTADGVYLYGDEKSGALSATYAFLEDRLGVRWIEPGDRGIACREQNPIRLRAGASRWVPKLVFRIIRRGINRAAGGGELPEELRPFQALQTPIEEHNRAVDDVVQWQRRLRMFGNRPAGGHAFTTWWAKYGAAHPEYFALNPSGRRAPVPPRTKSRLTGEDTVKMCPSCPGLADQIIAEWLPRKDRYREIVAGENDGAENFCECAACRALDVMNAGEKAGDHLTDRYVYLANAVARKARAISPDAWVALYAYLGALRPPRKIRVEPNVLVQIIPYVNTLDLGSVTDLFRGWHEAGARKLVLRPNYHHKYNTGVIPIGHEKQMFEVFQTAVRYGAVAADYDSLINNWPVTGMADYILAQAMRDPGKPFEYWEDHYAQAYGPAAEGVKAYFRYWRHELWDRRLYPDINKLADAGGAGDFIRGLMWSLDEYYSPEDFDKTDAILRGASEKQLTARERDRLNQLVLANRHARLVHNAVVAKGLAKGEPARQLLEFRKKYKDAANIRWLWCCIVEIGLGDSTGLKLAGELKDYQPPWLETDAVWRFRLDPDDAGLDQGWAAKRWDETAGWERIRTDAFWENQAEAGPELSRETREKLKRYDGLAWYSTQCSIPTELKGRRIFLRFGAVDESCWVYVNGQPAGQHLFEKGDDWKTPFEIQIDPLIDWKAAGQVVTVRVEDRNGVGGIWRPVWIVSKIGGGEPN